MRKINSALTNSIMLCWLLAALMACVETAGVENPDQTCFTKESLETVPWIVDALQPYKDPRMGGYYAAVYIYNGQPFLGISHPLDCTPIGHVFNCAGVPFDSLGLDANDFAAHRKLAVVLANPKM